MRFLILNIYIIFFATVVNAQTRDLNYYFEKAKVNSPLINESRNNSKIIQLNMQIVKSIIAKPNVNVEANILFAPIVSHDNNINKFQWVSQGANSYTGYDFAFSDGGQYQAFVSVRQPLFLGGVYDKFSKQADIQRQLNDNNISLTEHELKRLICHQYILCLMAANESEINKVLLEELNQQVQIMHKLVENAIYKQTDLMILQIERDNYKIAYEKYQNDYKSGIYDLNLLCGIDDTTIVNIEEMDFELSSNIVNVSQFIRKYELDSLNIQVNQNISEQKYKPQLGLFVNAGMNAIYTPSFNRLGFATGINLSWNIYDGNQRKIQRDKSHIQLQTLDFEKQNAINQYHIYKEKCLAQIDAIDKQIVIVKKQLLEYNKLIELYKFELSQAQVSIMDFKNIVRDIYAKNLEYLHLKMEKQSLINSYNYWNF